MMEYIREIAHKRACAVVELVVVAANENAYAFYRHLGLKEKTIVMEWLLTEENN